MFPHKTEDFLEAYWKTGMSPLKKEWVKKDGTCGCLMTVLAIAKGGVGVLEQIIHSNDDEGFDETCHLIAGYLNLTPGQVGCFAFGFDGFDYKPLTRTEEMAYEAGYKVRREMEASNGL